jgi:hypothetical protein
MCLCNDGYGSVLDCQRANVTADLHAITNPKTVRPRPPRIQVPDVFHSPRVEIGSGNVLLPKWRSAQGKRAMSAIEATLVFVAEAEVSARGFFVLRSIV